MAFSASTTRNLPFSPERGTADVSVNSRWFEGDKERRSLADQLQALEKKIQRDIDAAAKWQIKADELAANTAEPSSIEERFAEALLTDLYRKKREAKPETGADADAEEERYSSHFNLQAPDHICESTYVSVSAVPRLAANTQFAQRTSKPTGSFKTKFNSSNTSTTMPEKRSGSQFSSRPLAERITSVPSGTRPFYSLANHPPLPPLRRSKKDVTLRMDSIHLKHRRCLVHEFNYFDDRDRDREPKAAKRRDWHFTTMVYIIGVNAVQRWRGGMAQTKKTTARINI
ncbi:hypothetical protein FNAPI_4398 [Fusarium napiforme]|uniref:Uncharacterized protein n=1 Tax=Fusarium napiforme TaxID=42672 RepID=A0A8H5JTS1_9HYPO|nr:hypothetical protein FNAPI_4398 [Fusarium napiforme]